MTLFPPKDKSVIKASQDKMGGSSVSNMCRKGWKISSHQTFFIIMLVVLQSTSVSGTCNINGLAIIDIAENIAAGTLLKNISGVFIQITWDVDDTVSLTGDSYAQQFLGIQDTSFVITKEMDREDMEINNPNSDKNKLTFTFNCREPGGQDQTRSFTVKVRNVDDVYPYFINSPYETEVSELAAYGATVFDLTGKAKDGDYDNKTITRFAVVEGSEDYFLYVIPGKIIIQKELDYESGPQTFTLNISGTDDGQKTVYTTLTVTVTDGDDLSPVFTQSQYDLYIMENDTSLINEFMSSQPPVHAYDQDLGINQTLVYSLVGDDLDTAYFTINSSSGEVAARQVLDREERDQYVFQIKAAQTDSLDLRFALTFLTIYVLDSNDHVPVMSSSMYDVSLSENSKAGSYVSQVLATDGDQGANALFNYQINDTRGVFDINPTTGVITVKNPTLLDFEARTSLTFQVYAVETNTTERFQSVSSTVVVTLTDVNDNNPVFYPDTYYFNLNESWPLSTPFGQVFANDTDSNENGLIKYSLISATNGGLTKFDVNPDTGDLSVREALSVNYQAMYSLTLQAVDQPIDTSQSRRTSVTVMVNVTDVNNNPPILAPPSDMHISEATLIGTVLQQLVASDADTDAELMFSIVSGQDDKFNIDANSGVVKTISTLDRETKSFYSLRVKVTDGVYSDEAVLNITILDENDNAPTFNATKYEYSVEEEVIAPLSGDVIDATDRDEGNNSRIQYMIYSSWARDSFTIDVESGRLSTTRYLDRETRPRYQFTVAACDGGTPQRCTPADVVVTLIDINDNGPVITDTPTSVTVSENAAPTDLLKIQVNDGDTGLNAGTKFAITSGNLTLFALDSNTGQLSTMSPLNYETGVSYTVDILAYNTLPFEGPAASNLTNATTTIVVIVEDTNDNKPVFTQSTYHAQIIENIATSVIRVVATDPDINAEIRYHLGNSVGVDRFRIDPELGIISLKKSLDYEDGDQQFLLQVIATDGALNSTANVNISVIDSNDNPPVFHPAAYKVSVNETVMDGHTLLPGLNVTDADSGANGRFQFSIDLVQGPFSIDDMTGEIKVNGSLDYEIIKEYKFNIIARDSGDPPLIGSASITVQVINVNDKAPQFSQSIYNMSVPEFVPVNWYLGAVTASDSDSPHLQFNISSSSSSVAAVRVESESGQLFTNALLDYEQTQGYQIEVKVTDGEQEDTATVYVTVLDINDNSPVFTESVYHGNVSENSQPITLLQVSANDLDSGLNGEVTYSIHSGNEQGIFSINETSGEVSVVNGDLIDYETQSRYIIYTEAKDRGTPPRVGSTRIVLEVIDTNDKAPSFRQQLYEGTVMENSPRGTEILQVSVSDEDSSVIQYEVVKGSHQFTVDSSGIIHTTQPLDREEHAYLTLNISGCDPDFCDYTTVNISIIDVNDNPPEFTEGRYVATVPEDSEIGRPVITVQADDADSGNNKELTYWLAKHDGKFEINHRTGVVRLTGQLNQKVKDVYEMTVFVVDHGVPSLLTNVSLTVYVNVTNLHAPRFLEFNYDATVSENSPQDTLIIIVNTTDDDTGPAGQLEMSIIDGNDNDTFTISQSGVITNQHMLDYETQQFYELLVQVTDKAQDPKSSTTIVRVVIEDYNDNEPEFGETPAVVRIPKTLTDGHVFFSVTAYDADSELNGNNRISYNMSDSNLFSIDDHSGNITIAGPLIDGFYNLTLAAYDGGRPQLSSTINMTIEVFTPPGPYQPRFRQNYYLQYTEEGQPEGTFISNINAYQRVDNSLDDVGITYEISNGQRMDHYQINKTTGVVTIVKPLDREDIPKQSLLITAYGKGPGPNDTLYAEVGLYIFIKDINDNKPRFPFSQYDITVTEDKPLGYAVTTLKAVDPDASPQLSYSIIEDNADGTFTINNQGEVIIDKLLDRETMHANLSGIYSLMIEVSDGKYSGSNTSLRILVKDVNDNAPVFNSSLYTVNVLEDVPRGDVFFQVVATDVDDVDQGLITYTILEGNEGGHFAINNKTGELFVMNNLDRELNGTFLITIQALDSADNNATCQVNVSVGDVNDNTPHFVGEPYQVTVLEGDASLSLTVNVSAVDMDVGVNGQLSYSVLNDEHFNITGYGNYGTLRVVKSLDREMSEVYTVRVQVMDNGTPQRTNTTQVKIIVQDINDNPPLFKEKQYVVPSFSEGSPVSSVVLTVVATDNDYLPEYTNITYAIDTAGNEDETFKINKHSGVVALAKRLDITEHASYNLTLWASDGYLNSSVSLLIQLVDVNDNDPVFALSVYHFNVSENDGESGLVNQYVGQVNATDKDYGSNGEFVYSLTSRNARGLFNITQDGVITTIGELDRETLSEYVIIVTAKDKGIPHRQGTCEVLISVTDRNDNSPQFATSSYLGSVAEHSPADTPVQLEPSIVVTDKDLGTNEQIVFSLFGDGSHLFDISPSGQVSVKTSDNTALDREIRPVYHFQIIASDMLGHGNNGTANLTIELKDVNDKRPQFVKALYAFAVNENVSSNTLIGSVNATDDDIGNNKMIQYSIFSGNKGKFYIDRLTGDIFATGGLDRETTAHYLLNVSAQDRGLPTNLESFVSVNITIEDSNDNAPVFNQVDLTVHVKEDIDISSIVTTLAATDTDIGINTEISYSLNGSAPFRIAENGSIYVTGQLDRESTASYVSFIHAIDHGSPPLTGTATVTFIIDDVNDQHPVFDQKEYLENILEKSPVSSAVTYPHASDGDSGENARLEYSLHGPAASYFTINNVTGLIKIAKTIDKNELLQLGLLGYGVYNQTVDNSTIVLTITATDMGEPRLNGTALLLVKVDNINDDTPRFTNATYDVHMDEDLPSGGYLTTVSASVKSDGVILKYSIESSRHFEMKDELSGNISILSRVDRELQDRYTFSVKAVDGRIPERTAYAVVSVTVDDVNDNAPDCLSSQLDFVLPEGSYTNHRLTTLTCTDQDIGKNGQIVYSIQQAPAGTVLYVNRTTGELVVNGELDRENVSFYNMSVMASDMGNPPLNSSIMVSLKVQDKNDNAPVFYQFPHSPVTIRENQKPGIDIATVYANDTDVGLNGRVFYSLQETLEIQMFYIINKDSVGYIKTLYSFDYETRSLYNLTVVATDLGSSPRQSTVQVIVNVTDVNDNLPSFSQDVYEVEVVDTFPVGTLVFQLDAGATPLHYSVISDNSDEMFKVNTTGAVYVAKQLSQGKDTVFNMTVIASDHYTPPSNDTTIVRFTIKQSSKRPVFEKNVYDVVFKEGQKPPVLLIDLNTTDEISGIGVIYSIVSGNELGAFMVNNKTGEVLCIKKLDRESVSTYTLKVRADRSSKLTRRRRRNVDDPSVVTLVISVGDVNDNPPVFLHEPYTMGVPLDSTLNYEIGTFKANDGDLGDSPITYSLVPTGEDFELFNIQSNTGVLYTRSKFNTLKKTALKIQVKATDDKGQGMSTTTNATVYILSDNQRVILSADVPKKTIEDNLSALVGNLSAILSYQVIVEKVEMQIKKKNTVDFVVDPEATDMYIFALDADQNIVSRDDLLARINAKSAEIQKLFGSYQLKGKALPVTSTTTRIGALEGAFIALGGVLFFASIVGVIVAIVSWKQREAERLQNEKTNNLYVRPNDVDGFSALNGITMENPAFTADSLDHLDIDSEHMRVFALEAGKDTATITLDNSYSTRDLYVNIHDDMSSNESCQKGSPDQTDSGAPSVTDNTDGTWMMPYASADEHAQRLLKDQGLTEVQECSIDFYTDAAAYQNMETADQSDLDTPNMIPMEDLGQDSKHPDIVPIEDVPDVCFRDSNSGREQLDVVPSDPHSINSGKKEYKSVWFNDELNNSSPDSDLPPPPTDMMMPDTPDIDYPLPLPEVNNEQDVPLNLPPPPCEPAPLPPAVGVPEVVPPPPDLPPPDVPPQDVSINFIPPPIAKSSLKPTSVPSSESPKQKPVASGDLMLELSTKLNTVNRDAVPRQTEQKSEPFVLSGNVDGKEGVPAGKLATPGMVRIRSGFKQPGKIDLGWLQSTEL